MSSNVFFNARLYSQNNKVSGKIDVQPNNYTYYKKNYEKRILKNQSKHNPSAASNQREINNNQNQKIFLNNYKNNNIIATNNIKRNDVICPECGEHVFINIKDYKITLYGCKYKDKTENILLNEFMETQKKGLSSIKCGICLVKNKNNIENNEFYRCLDCKLNLCPECKFKHPRKHKIVNHEQKYYTCKKHNYTNRSFCKTCKRNLCFICQGEHKGHDIISLQSLYENKNKIKNEIEEMKSKIEKYTKIINNIKKMLDFTVSNMEMYYKINYDIFNNCQRDYLNYEVLSNLYTIKENNKIEDIDNLINTTDINKQFSLICDIYKKMINKEENKSQSSIYSKPGSRQERLNDKNKTKESLVIDAKPKEKNNPNNIQQNQQIENNPSNIIRNSFLNSNINKKEKKINKFNKFKN